MSEQKFDATEIVFHAHGHQINLAPANGYVHGAITGAPKGNSVLTIQRDEATGKVRIHIDRK